MTTEAIIKCPTCKSEIKLTEAMAGPMVQAARSEFETKLKNVKTEADADAAKRAQSFIQKEVGKYRSSIEGDLQAAKDRAAESERLLQEREAKLAEAQKAQADLVRQKREFEEKSRELDLTIEKRVTASASTIREEARAAAEADLGAKVSERELLIDRMKKQMSEMQKKIEQGSQQAQGEVLELELENTLRSRFVFDSIEPVAKGVFGGDVIQRVSEHMIPVGTILWEMKRTKNWTEGWLAKLRGDQRAAKAEIAIIVSYVLPEGISTFGMREGIWISAPAYAVELCAVLRHALAEVAAARQASEGQESKMQMLYSYLTGSGFKHRVQAIVENFGNMLEDLEKERKVQERVWAKREGQIRIAMKAAAGMYGDLQGIAGSSLKEVEGLNMPELPETAESTAVTE